MQSPVSLPARSDLIARMFVRNGALLTLPVLTRGRRYFEFSNARHCHETRSEITTGFSETFHCIVYSSNEFLVVLILFYIVRTQRSLNRDLWKANYKIINTIRVLMITVAGSATSWLCDKRKSQINELWEPCWGVLKINLSVTKKGTHIWTKVSVERVTPIFMLATS